MLLSSPTFGDRDSQNLIDMRDPLQSNQTLKGTEVDKSALSAFRDALGTIEKRHRKTELNPEKLTSSFDGILPSQGSKVDESNIFSQLPKLPKHH